MSEGDWHDPSLSAFGCVFGEHERFLLLFNAGAETETFFFPQARGAWSCVIDTGSADGSSDTRVASSAAYAIGPHSLILFKNMTA
jgi:pullulanase/glycogen debranching enzyme